MKLLGSAGSDLYRHQIGIHYFLHRNPHVDETFVRVKGEWCYLYRAVDSEGTTVEFFLSAFRDK
jgi:transposase-like protein